MSSEHQHRNSRQHKYNPANRNGPRPQRNMERSWRRTDSPAESEMSASAWRSPQDFIIEQDHIRRAERIAEQERNASSSTNPTVINTKLEIVNQSPSPTEATAAAPVTPSTSATTTICSVDSDENSAPIPSDHNSNGQTHINEYYINPRKSQGLISLEDINVSGSLTTTASSSPDKSTIVHSKSGYVEPVSKDNGNGNEPANDGNGSWRNFNKESGQKSRQRNDRSNRNRQNRHHHQQQQQQQQHQLNKPWRHMHPDDHHYPNQPTLYKYFMEYDKVMAGLEKGDLFKSQLRINKRKRMDAYATSDTLEDDIYICGEIARNRALDGDIVVVRLLDVDTVWEDRLKREKRFSEKKLKLQNQDGQRQHQNDTTAQNDESTPITDNNDETNDNDNAIPVVTLAEDDTVNAKDNTAEQDEDDDESSARKPKYAGEVVYIMDRAEGRTYTGTISKFRPGATQKKADKEIKYVWFKPTDKRIPLMMVDVRYAPKDVISDAESYAKQLVEVALDRWSISYKAPFGRFIRSLGSIGDLYVEEQAILTDNNIMDTPFSPLVIQHLDEIPRTIAAVEIGKRRDLRNELIFTIDPVTAKDLDDALHIKRLDDGNFEVGVHIADVSYYVKQDSLLDSEAKRRGTTTYLVNRSIPMLPTALCEELCSLTPLEDKLAFSVIWKLDQDGHAIDTWFGRTVIRSCAKLAYEDAQSVIDHGHLPEDKMINDYSNEQVESNIKDLFKLSAAMRKRRYEDGALSLNSIKLSFTLNDDGEPVGVSVFEAKEANKLVEEYMLLANISVARKIWEHYPACSLLRRHECPIERRLNQFLDLTRELGYNFDVGSAAGLQTSFDELDDMDVKGVLQVLAIQPMKRATYICSGAARNKQYLHYALNQDYYTHFTSPIRRYADVIVHRLLAAAIAEKGDCGYDTKTVQKIALRCNRKKDGAKNAQESDIMLYLADYITLLEKMEGTQTEKAVVIDVGKKRFDVYVPKYGLEYCIQPGALPMKDFVYEDGRLDLYWKAGIPATAAYLEKARERKWDDTDDYNDNDIQIADDDGVDQMTRQLTDANVGTENKAESDGDVGVDLPRRLHATPLDNDKCMQSIDMLGTIKVNIIPDKSQTPPRIHIFPINPFC